MKRLIAGMSCLFFFGQIDSQVMSSTGNSPVYLGDTASHQIQSDNNYCLDSAEEKYEVFDQQPCCAYGLSISIFDPIQSWLSASSQINPSYHIFSQHFNRGPPLHA